MVDARCYAAASLSVDLSSCTQPKHIFVVAVLDFVVKGSSELLCIIHKTTYSGCKPRNTMAQICSNTHLVSTVLQSPAHALNNTVSHNSDNRMHHQDYLAIRNWHQPSIDQAPALAHDLLHLEGVAACRRLWPDLGVLIGPTIAATASAA